MKSFLNDKYTYYRLYITNDILGSNDYNNCSRYNESGKIDNIINKTDRKVSGDSNISFHHYFENHERVIRLNIPGNEMNQNIDKYNTNHYNIVREYKEKNELNNANIQEKLSQNSLSTYASNYTIWIFRNMFINFNIIKIIIIICTSYFFRD